MTGENDKKDIWVKKLSLIWLILSGLCAVNCIWIDLSFSIGIFNIIFIILYGILGLSVCKFNDFKNSQQLVTLLIICLCCLQNTYISIIQGIVIFVVAGKIKLRVIAFLVVIFNILVGGLSFYFNNEEVGKEVYSPDRNKVLRLVVSDIGALGYGFKVELTNYYGIFKSDMYIDSISSGYVNELEMYWVDNNTFYVNNNKYRVK